uniref:Uncharacterized protein n=1 Tax=Lutzomyia longipalpis TaxID=7200 RepID=A0A1B0CGB5_LUTLO
MVSSSAKDEDGRIEETTPIVMGHIVTDKTREQWQIVFFITASIYLCGAIFCWFFVRGTLQPWAKIDQEKLAAKKKELENDKTESAEN